MTSRLFGGLSKGSFFCHENASHKSTISQKRVESSRVSTVSGKMALKLPTNLSPSPCLWRWQEAGVPGENPGSHWENMLTPHRKTLIPGIKLGTFLLKGTSTDRYATVLRVSISTSIKSVCTGPEAFPGSCRLLRAKDGLGSEDQIHPWLFRHVFLLCWTAGRALFLFHSMLDKGFGLSGKMFQQNFVMSNLLINC